MMLFDSQNLTKKRERNGDRDDKIKKDLFNCNLPLDHNNQPYYYKLTLILKNKKNKTVEILREYR